MPCSQKKYAAFYMLMVLKLVICSIFIGKEGQCVISCLPSFSLNIQDSKSVHQPCSALVTTCLKTQGNILSKSVPVLRDCS